MKKRADGVLGPDLSEISVRAMGPATRAADVASLARHLVEHAGYVYLKDLSETFSHLALLRLFGDFMPQYDGSFVWDLKPEPGMDDVYHSGNTHALVPHTEAYEFDGNPPRYLALWAVQPAIGPGGETTLADGYRFLQTFTEPERERLRTQSCEWHSSEGLARRNVYLSSHHRILTEHGGATIFRYSYNNMSAAGDPFLEQFLNRGLEFFEREKHTIDIERDGLLLWDNWRMMHSRNAFSDPGRHLKRILVA